MESDKEEQKKEDREEGEGREPKEAPKAPVDWSRKDVIVQEDDGEIN